MADPKDQMEDMQEYLARMNRQLEEMEAQHQKTMAQPLPRRESLARATNLYLKRSRAQAAASPDQQGHANSDDEQHATAGGTRAYTGLGSRSSLRRSLADSPSIPNEPHFASRGASPVDRAAALPSVPATDGGRLRTRSTRRALDWQHQGQQRAPARSANGSVSATTSRAPSRVPSFSGIAGGVDGSVRKSQQQLKAAMAEADAVSTPSRTKGQKNGMAADAARPPRARSSLDGALHASSPTTNSRPPPAASRPPGASPAAARTPSQIRRLSTGDAAVPQSAPPQARRLSLGNVVPSPPPSQPRCVRPVPRQLPSRRAAQAALVLVDEAAAADPAPAIAQRTVESPFKQAGVGGWAADQQAQAAAAHAAYLQETHGSQQQQQQQQQQQRVHSGSLPSTQAGSEQHTWSAPQPTHVTSSVSALGLDNSSTALPMALEAQSLSRRSSHQRRNYVDAEPSLIDGDTSMLSATSVEDATDISAFAEDSFLQRVAPGLAAWIGPDVTDGPAAADDRAAGADVVPSSQLPLRSGAAAVGIVPEHASNAACLSPCSAIDASYSEIVCQGSVEGLPHEALMHAQEQGGEVTSGYRGRTPSPAAWQHWQPPQKQVTLSAHQLLQQQQQQLLQQQQLHQQMQQEAQRWQQANAVQQPQQQQDNTARKGMAEAERNEQQSQLQAQQLQAPLLSKSSTALGSASSSKAVASLLHSGLSTDDVPLSQITQVLRSRTSSHDGQLHTFQQQPPAATATIPGASSPFAAISRTHSGAASSSLPLDNTPSPFNVAQALHSSAPEFVAFGSAGSKEDSVLFGSPSSSPVTSMSNMPRLVQPDSAASVDRTSRLRRASLEVERQHGVTAGAGAAAAASGAGAAAAAQTADQVEQVEGMGTAVASNAAAGGDGQQHTVVHSSMSGTGDGEETIEEEPQLQQQLEQQKVQPDSAAADMVQASIIPEDAHCQPQIVRDVAEPQSTQAEDLFGAYMGGASGAFFCLALASAAQEAAAQQVRQEKEQQQRLLAEAQHVAGVEQLHGSPMPATTASKQQLPSAADDATADATHQEQLPAGQQQAHKQLESAAATVQHSTVADTSSPASSVTASPIKQGWSKVVERLGRALSRTVRADVEQEEPHKVVEQVLEDVLRLPMLSQAPADAAEVSWREPSAQAQGMQVSNAAAVGHGPTHSSAKQLPPIRPHAQHLASTVAADPVPSLPQDLPHMTAAAAGVTAQGAASQTPQPAPPQPAGMQSSTPLPLPTHTVTSDAAVMSAAVAGLGLVAVSGTQAPHLVECGATLHAPMLAAVACILMASSTWQQQRQQQQQRRQGEASPCAQAAAAVSLAVAAAVQVANHVLGVAPIAAGTAGAAAPSSTAAQPSRLHSEVSTAAAGAVVAGGHQYADAVGQPMPVLTQEESQAERTRPSSTEYESSRYGAVEEEEEDDMAQHSQAAPGHAASIGEEMSGGSPLSSYAHAYLRQLQRNEQQKQQPASQQDQWQQESTGAISVGSFPLAFSPRSACSSDGTFATDRSHLGMQHSAADAAAEGGPAAASLKAAAAAITAGVQSSTAGVHDAHELQFAGSTGTSYVIDGAAVPSIVPAPAGDDAANTSAAAEAAHPAASSSQDATARIPARAHSAVEHLKQLRLGRLRTTSASGDRSRAESSSPARHYSPAAGHAHGTSPSWQGQAGEFSPAVQSAAGPTHQGLHELGSTELVLGHGASGSLGTFAASGRWAWHSPAGKSQASGRSSAGSTPAKATPDKWQERQQQQQQYGAQSSRQQQQQQHDVAASSLHHSGSLFLPLPPNDITVRAEDGSTSFAWASSTGATAVHQHTTNASLAPDGTQVARHQPAEAGSAASGSITARARMQALERLKRGSLQRHQSAWAVQQPASGEQQGQQQQQQQREQEVGRSISSPPKGEGAWPVSARRISTAPAGVSRQQRQQQQQQQQQEEEQEEQDWHAHSAAGAQLQQESSAPLHADAVPAPKPFLKRRSAAVSGSGRLDWSHVGSRTMCHLEDRYIQPARTSGGKPGSASSKQRPATAAAAKAMPPAKTSSAVTAAWKSSSRPLGSSADQTPANGHSAGTGIGAKPAAASLGYQVERHGSSTHYRSQPSRRSRGDANKMDTTSKARGPAASATPKVAAPQAGRSGAPTRRVAGKGGENAGGGESVDVPESPLDDILSHVSSLIVEFDKMMTRS